MDRNRKILVSILALLALSAIIAIADISMTIKEKQDSGISMAMPNVGPGVGVIKIDGPIEMTGQRDFLGLESGAEAVIAHLDNLSKSGKIKALVVRINSPGGTVAATQEIYHKLWKLRKLNIPIVASMGDIAASGGYYIASACNVIMAN